MTTIGIGDVFACCLVTALFVSGLAGALGFCNGRLAEIDKRDLESDDDETQAS